MDDGAAPSGAKDGSALPPGTLTALLRQLAEAPAADVGAGWSATLRPGAVIGRFELVRELGRGGFGVVWEARDRELGRRVAFKAVRAGGRAALREERLLREAEAAAQLSHPNLVTLFDLGRAEPGPYLVLELLQGETLEDRLARGPLPLEEAVRIAGEVAEGVAHAHARGVVHRDLKPGNVFLCEDGRVKVLDFGLAHAFGQRRQDGGTPGYMAPEQWEGAPEDERTDVFAIGVLLHRMLAGQLPFRDPEGKDHRSSRPAPALDVEALPALGALVGRMLSKRPVERPRDGGEVAAALRSLRAELGRTPSTAPSPVRTRRWPGRRLARLAAAGVAVALLAGGAAWWRSRARAAALAGADGRIVVAVADFSNETRDPDLDDLAGLLVTSLEESRRLRVVTRSRMGDVLRQMGRTGAEPIDERLGREVARREGVRALLLASVRRLGETYAVDLRALDPARDEYLFALREQAPDKGALFDLVDRLSVRTRRALQEPGSEVRASELRVGEAATSSIEAWRHYAEGLVQERAGRQDLATASWRRAVAIDPRFALAWFRIAYRGWFVTGAEIRLAMESALRELDRLPEKDRLLVEGWKARWDGRRDEAIAILSRAADAYPREKELAASVGTLVLGKGAPGDAAPWFERALALDPFYEVASQGLVEALVLSGRADDAIRGARARLEAAPGRVSARALASALQLAGRPGEAADVMRRYAERDGSSGAKLLLADALCVADRPEEAERLLRPVAASSTEQQAIVQLADALTEQGRRREALALFERLTEPGLRTFLRHLLLMGDRDPRASLREGRKLLDAERLAGNGGRLFTGFFHLRDPGLAAESAALLPPGQGPLRAEYDAILLWWRGEKERSLAALRALEGEIQLRARRHWWRARVAYELGEVEEGDAALLAFEREPSGIWRGWGRAQLLVWSAEAHARRGEVEKALAALDRLDRIWARADRDLPQLEDARALRRRLAARARAAAPAAAASVEAPAPSVAVLPFADMSPGKDQEYLSDGIAEEILNALASVEGLRVPGRSSSFHFKGRNAAPAEIARKLGVAHLLDGSVRRSGDKIRVTAELVQVSTGERLWSQTFERKVDDIFAVQDAIARAVVEALKVRLLAGAAYAGPRRTTTTSPEAYEHYLRGQRLYRQFTPEGVRQAVEAFERAVALDPGYAPAWAVMGIPMFYVGASSPSPEEALASGEKALASAEKALALAPDLCDGLSARGSLRGSVRWDWTGGLADLARAVKLCPGNPDGWRRYSIMLANLGRIDEAVAPAERAVQLDPLGYSNLFLSSILRAAGNAERSLAAAERALDALPGSDPACGSVANALLTLGRPAESLERLRRCKGAGALTRHGIIRALWSLGRADEARTLLAKEEQQPSPRWWLIGIAHAWMGDSDRAFESLGHAVDTHELLLGDGILVWPELRPLHTDPRWKAMRHRMNLPAD